LLEFGVVSHLSAAVVYGLLAGFTATRYLRRNSDRAVLLASILTTLWALIVVAQNLWGWPDFTIRYLTELTRNGAWILVLFALVRDAREGAMISRRMVIFTAGAFTMILSLLALAALVGRFSGGSMISARSALFGQLAFSLLGVSVLEQIWRNASTYGRSSIRYICFGVGGIFIFEFILYADALLFDRMSKGLWDARGAVNVLLVPLFAVNLINSRRQPVELQLSRNFVFHAGTFVVGGIYLLVVAAAGYYVRLAGGEWGEGLQVLFIAGFVLLFVLLMTSNHFRARLMMFVSQNFFDYKYDYRDEWLKNDGDLQQPDRGSTPSGAGHPYPGGPGGESYRRALVAQ
jgi:hypothetical protein